MQTYPEASKSMELWRHRGISGIGRLSLLGIFALLALLSSCSGIRTSGETSLVRGRTFTGNPVTLWCDVAGAGQALSDPAVAASFCKVAVGAGVTHLALEDRGGGEWETLRPIATRAGLRLGAVVPLFLAPEGTAAGDVVQKAFWKGDRWEIQPLSAAGLPDLFPPFDREVQRQELARIRALASDPENEFILLSGLGFQDTLADLSPAARIAFQAWSGVSLRTWPEDVIGGKPAPLPIGPWERGPYWDYWTMWRATVLKDFLLKVFSTISEEGGAVGRPGLAVLVDGPFPAHQRLGLNWGKSDSRTAADYRWLPVGYESTAAGHLLDTVVLGLWEPGILNAAMAEREGFAWWASVEGASAAGKRFKANATRVLGAVEAVGADSEWGNALRLSMRLNDGILILSASDFLEKPERWRVLSDAVRTQPRS